MAIVCIGVDLLRQIIEEQVTLEFRDDGPYVPSAKYVANAIIEVIRRYPPGSSDYKRRDMSGGNMEPEPPPSSVDWLTHGFTENE